MLKGLCDSHVKYRVKEQNIFWFTLGMGKLTAGMI